MTKKQTSKIDNQPPTNQQRTASGKRQTVISATDTGKTVKQETLNNTKEDNNKNNSNNNNSNNNNSNNNNSNNNNSNNNNERQERGKKIQYQIDSLQKLTDNDELPSEETIRADLKQLEEKDYKTYFSELLDFPYKQVAQNLMDTKPTDLNKKQDIETWLEDSANFIHQFDQYRNNINELIKLIKDTIDILAKNAEYDQLMKDLKKKSNKKKYENLTVFQKILAKHETKKILAPKYFLWPESYVWMILCDKKDQSKTYSNMLYNSLEALEKAEKEELKDFSKHFNKIASSKADLSKIKTNMERFLNKQP